MHTNHLCVIVLNRPCEGRLEEGRPVVTVVTVSCLHCLGSSREYVKAEEENEKRKGRQAGGRTGQWSGSGEYNNGPFRRKRRKAQEMVNASVGAISLEQWAGKEVHSCSQLHSLLPLSLISYTMPVSLTWIQLCPTPLPMLLHPVTPYIYIYIYIILLF